MGSDYTKLQVVQKDEQPAAENVYKIDAGSSLIVAGPDSTGTMNVIVSGGKADTKPLKIVISGADVVSSATLRGSAIDDTAGVFTIKGNGETQFALRNLFPGQSVSVQLYDDKDKKVGSPLVRAVYWSAGVANPDSPAVVRPHAASGCPAF
jgi:hypothetical protein